MSTQNVSVQWDFFCDFSNTVHSASNWIAFLSFMKNKESLENDFHRCKIASMSWQIEKKIALRIECWISILKQSKRKPLLCIKRKGGQRPYAYMPTHIWRREKVIKLWREIEKKSRSFIFLRLQSLDITLVTVTNIGDW